MIVEEYPKVGQLIDKPAEVYRLFIEDFVQAIIIGEMVVNPTDYFITSGDAVRKTDQLLKDMSILVEKVDDKSLVQPEHIDNIEGCKKMKKALEVARGPAIFMETEWEYGVLLCIPKNPRIKK